MDPDVVKRTQDTLGRVIKKPPMTEKLLNKPPFRFLHDIVTEVIKTNGFFKGLYQNAEMNSANVKEKDAKISFLQKAIDCLVFATGESLSVRPSKVVAGHEPEKTNEFLQLIGKACLKKLDSKDSVKKVLAGEKPGVGSTIKKKESKSGKERVSEKENRVKESESKKDKINEDDGRKRKSSSGRLNSSDTRIRSEAVSDGKNHVESKESFRGRSKERDRKKERSSNKQDLLKEQAHEVNEENSANKIENDSTDAVDGEVDSQNRSIPRPSSAKGQRRRPNDESEEQIPLKNNDEINGVLDSKDVPNEEPELPKTKRKLARPSSARPAPPRKKRQSEEQDESLDKVASSSQVINVIVDNNKDDDGDDTFLVEEAPDVSHDVLHNEDEEPMVNEKEDEHGALVKKMLETKKELENDKHSKAETTSRPVISDAHRRKQREHAQKEIEKLRESIQTLCRSANPLGKIMDYIQEDMDSMQKELEMWKEENKEHQIALRREQSITEREVEPLKVYLFEMEAEVNEMFEKIGTVKCNILRNEEKIEQLLSGVAV
ncbi:TRAF3-interacting protein 1-like isoform X2 [Xenia sp. Carnegie-2017]|uniref:TRAF3-interacting protein 1-like isoform X2 n=1 Tax=Xenia sp. Carnegie-2017 TaxID=2897299 RepID=UPI001F03DEC6|nr:TRAF3-interacting protein 1-like isoform X2 [Xenia sp. Carnegie-2017]